MATCLARFNRLYSSLIFLAFTANAFAYTPPATPNLPLSFEFLGPNAEAESTAFYNTQCDSNNFSWYGTDWFCAVGDPSNPVCYVKMAYFSSDVNHCQTYVPPEQPTPFLEPDTFTEKGGSNQNLISKLELMRIQDFNKNYEDGQYQNTDLALSRQNNSLLSSLNRTLQYANDNRSIVDAINSWGSTNHLEMRSQFEQDNHYKVRNEIRTKEFYDLFSEPWDSQGGMVQDIDNISFYSAQIDSKLSWLSDWVIPNVATVINNSASNDSSLERSLLIQIEDAINSLGGIGTPSDNTAIVDQLVESNNSLSDITLRMRDIENAIGKSEKSIVDAIGKGGDGTEPDLVSSADCASFSCSSSSAICYIARKEWEKSCASSGQDAENQAGVDKLTNQLKEYIDSPDSSLDNIDAGKINTTTLLNHYSDSNGVSVGGSNTCPPPYTVDIVITTVTIDLSPFCDLAAVIRWFLIAFATVGAGLMIAKYS